MQITKCILSLSFALTACFVTTSPGSDTGMQTTVPDAGDADTPDAATSDASMTDAQSDGASDGGCASCITTPITWGSNGGLVAWFETSSIQCATYTKTRESSGRLDGGTASCSEPLSACVPRADGGTEAASIDDLNAALNNEEVKAAFAGSVVLYGGDPRPCDGAVLRVTLGAKSIDIGPECDEGCGLPTTACTPVPPGLRHLQSILQGIDSIERGRPACSALAL